MAGLVAKKSMVCGYCGKQFKTHRSNARFCCSACRQAGYRAEKKAELENLLCRLRELEGGKNG